jgi:hypothetical protein
MLYHFFSLLVLSVNDLVSIFELLLRDYYE